MAQKIEGKEERPLQSYHLKDFLAVNTTNARTATPNAAFYDLTNIQPIGSANLHSVNGISALLHDFAGDTIYRDQSVNVNGTEYLICAGTNGTLFAYNIQSGATTNIATAGTLSGANTRIVQWKNTEVLIIDTNNYYGWNGAGLITILGGTTGAPSSGTCIAVYQSRVWIAQARLLYYSAPDSFSDFQTASGGGFRNLTDSTLRSTVMNLYTANGFLYVFGLTSVDAISDVYVPTGASPPTPNFTYLNLDALIGTDQPDSIASYGRLITFANQYGVYSLYGTTIQPISGVDPNNTYQSSIDGTWQYVDFGQKISAAQFKSNNLLCVGFLIRRASDPVFGSNTVIAVYQGNAAGGRWWFGNFGTVTRITTGIVSGVVAVFGYIGNKLFQLFADTTSSPAGSFMTALWDFDDPITAKEAIRAGFGISVFKLGGTFSFNLDTTQGSYPLSNLASGAVQWVNNFGNTVTWVNNFSQPVTWVAGTFQTYWGKSPPGFAKYIGFSFAATAGSIYEINSILLDYKWAARWTGN